jgi:hypothetical protein
MATVLVADAIGAGIDEQVVARATSSVVAVDAGLQGSGSAVCVDASGLFVTNRHVVDAFGAAGTVRLVIDAGTDRARSVEARVINTAMEDDLALLRTVDPVPNLRPMPIARASDIRVTEPVAALGFPGGQGRDAVGSEWPPCTVTFGNLTERQMQDEELRFLSFDATIYPGNSGGALINRDGELIGVVTMTLQAGGRHLGVNGAVSVNRVRRFLEQPPLYGEFEPIEYRRRFDEHTATLHFEPDRNIEGPVEVKLIVGPPGNERVYPAEAQGAGKYTCRFHPFAPDKPVPVRLQPARGGERLVQDGPIRVGNLELRLSDLAETHGDRVQLVSGQILYGAVSGDLTLLDSSGADVGRFALPDERCRVEAPGQVPFQIEARTGRQLLGRSRGALALPTHTPSQIVRPSNPRPFSLPGRILHVDVGGGGEVLAIVVAGETKVRLFDMARGRWLKSVQVGPAVKALALGRNLLAVVGEDVGAIHIFD